jgi:hypothetical protein
MRRKRAEQVIRELRRQPAITWVFVGSIVVVIARTALLSVPEVFPGGARIGEVLFDLAITYIAAWMFNLLVVVLPQLRGRDRVLDAAGRVISRLSEVGLRMPTAMVEGARTQASGQSLPSEEWLTSIGRRLSLGAPSPLRVPAGVAMRPATWQEWVSHSVGQVESLNASLVPYFPFLEVDLIGLVNNVVLSDFVERGREIARLPTPVEGDMSSLARPLADFITACAALREYYNREVVQGGAG